MWFKFFPLFYTFESRIKTKAERLSWVLIYPLFILLSACLVNFNLVYVLILFLATMSCYEIGYLFNDIITVKKEVAPTLRLGKLQHWYEVNFKKHIFFRLFFCSSAIFFFIFLDENVIAENLLFGLIAIQVFYFLHNNIRNRFNILTYFLLVCSRYIVPIFIIWQPVLFSLVILSFPLCRTIEHCCKKKYEFTKISRLVGNPDRFRVIYYLIFFLVALIFIGNKEAIILSGYFLMIRTLGFFVSKKRAFKRNKHSAY